MTAILEGLVKSTSESWYRPRGGLVQTQAHSRHLGLRMLLAAALLAACGGAGSAPSASKPTGGGPSFDGRAGPRPAQRPTAAPLNVAVVGASKLRPGVP